MATKYAALKDEEVVRMVRASVTESGAATFTETTIDTQLSIERGVIWMISAVEFFQELSKHSEVGANGLETQNIQLTRESKTAIVELNDSDVIAKLQNGIYRSAAIGTDAGPLWLTWVMPVIQYFDPPLPYASQNMYLGFQTTAATVRSCYVRIRYTIRTVSDKYFFRVAQALLG